MRGFLAVMMTSGILLAGMAAPAWSQSDLSTLLDRLTRMEQDLNALQRQVYRDGVPASSGNGSASSAAVSDALPATIAGRLEVRLTNVEAEMRSLTGRVEEVNHAISTVSDRLDKLVADVDYRLSLLENGGSPAQPGQTGSLTAPSDSGQPGTAPGPGSLGTLTQEQLDTSNNAASIQPFAEAVTLPDGPPEAQYEFAFELLKRKEFDKAANAFTQFVEAHPKHKLAGNAQYWLGETFYARADFERAAIAFAEGFKSYNSGPKAPDNMLKLGMSLAEIGRTDQACTAFKKLADAYPSASATIKQRAATERRRINCT